MYVAMYCHLATATVDFHIMQCGLLMYLIFRLLPHLHKETNSCSGGQASNNRDRATAAAPADSSMAPPAGGAHVSWRAGGCLTSPSTGRVATWLRSDRGMVRWEFGCTGWVSGFWSPDIAIVRVEEQRYGEVRCWTIHLRLSQLFCVQ